MVVMKRKLPLAILAALVLLMTIPQLAVAGDINWRINMQENGRLHEEVRIEGTEIAPADASWQLSREGEINIWSRDVQDWSAYQTLPEGLPLQVQQRNFLIGQQTVISIDPGGAVRLGNQITAADPLRLTISAPGFIFASTAQRPEGYQQASWDFPDSAALLQADGLARIIAVDGLLLGIGIILLGLLWIGIRFRRHLKKAKQIIAEEYALPPQKS